MPKIVDKDQKRREILAAAMPLLARRGVGGTKMADVAAAAGIGKGTIYEYFPSKEALVLGLYAYLFRNMDELLEPILTADAPALDKITAILRASADMMTEQEETLAVVLDAWALGIGERHTEAARMLREMYENYRTLVAGIITAGIDAGEIHPMEPRSAASWLLGTLDGLMLQTVMEKNAVNVQEAVSSLCRTIEIGWKG